MKGHIYINAQGEFARHSIVLKHGGNGHTLSWVRNIHDATVFDKAQSKRNYSQEFCNALLEQSVADIPAEVIKTVKLISKEDL